VEKHSDSEVRFDCAFSDSDRLEDVWVKPTSRLILPILAGCDFYFGQFFHEVLSGVLYVKEQS
jgi:hypothetical protein